MIVRSKAPLRLGFAGGGTDLSPYCDIYGGVVLNATINMYAHCTIETLDNGKIVLEALDLNEREEYDILSFIEPTGSLKLLKGVYNRIIKDFNNEIGLSVKISTYCDVPVGSGLGTSSTMVVSIIKCFVEFLKLPFGEYDIAKLAFDIERKDLKLSGGKQDQYAATFGGFNFIEFYKDNQVIVNPLRIRKWIIHELEESLILFFTGTSRESGNIIDEQIRSTTENKEKNLAAMHELKNIAYKLKEEILKGNICGIANELNKGWIAKKRTSKSITNNKIDEIYGAAIKSGAIAGKISGAGGGGFLMFIVEPTKKLEVIRTLEKYEGKVEKVEFVEHGAKAWYL